MTIGVNYSNIFNVPTENFDDLFNFNFFKNISKLNI